MTSTFDTRRRHEGITISTIDVAVALSILLHILALWTWPSMLLMRPFDDPRKGEPGGSLAVRLAPLPAPPSTAESRPAPPAPALSAPGGARRPPPASHVLAMERPSPSAAPAVQPAAPAPPAQNPALLGQDLASFIEARRRAREPAAPAAPEGRIESEQERINREAADRLGLNRAPSFGSNRIAGGGTFQIGAMYYDHAELAFYGWNKAIQRVSLQKIDVSRGSNPSIELAIVRKVIAIIREEASGDFRWESLRQNRDVKLSARPADNAALEAFLMDEFFDAGGVRRN